MGAPDLHDLPYDEQIAEISRKLSFARQTVGELEAELDWWTRGRELYGGTRDPNKLLDRKPTLAQALVVVMESGLDPDMEKREWTAPEIMEALRAQGWMPNGKNAEHTVRTKLGQLARPDGPLVRVRHGVYALREVDETKREASGAAVEALFEGIGR